MVNTVVSNKVCDHRGVQNYNRSTVVVVVVSWAKAWTHGEQVMHGSVELHQQTAEAYTYNMFGQRRATAGGQEL